MKSIPKIYRQLPIVCMLMVLLFSSCSKESVTDRAERRAELISELPDDAMITVAFSPAAILKSAGMEPTADGIKVSKPLERVIASNKSLKEIVSFISEAKGIDYSAAVIAGGMTDGYVLFAISDAHKFSDWAKGKGMTITNSGSYIICYQRPSTPAIVIDGHTAWFIGSAASSEKALSIVENSKTAAAGKKIAQWKIDRLINDDVNVIVNIESYTNQFRSALSASGIMSTLPNIYGAECAYTTCDINFSGPTVKIIGEAYDETGNLTSIYNQSSLVTVPSAALNLVKDSQIALAVSLPDSWKELLSQMSGIYNMDKEQSDIAVQVLNSLNSVTFGLSTSENLSIANLKPSDILANLIFSYDKNSADKAIAKMMPVAKSLGVAGELTKYWDAWCGKSTYTITPESFLPAFKIYLSGKDQFAFISTNSGIRDTNLSADPKLEGIIAYSRIDLKKSHPALILADCPFGIDSRFTSTNEKSEGYLTLTETDGPILENLISFISRFL